MNPPSQNSLFYDQSIEVNEDLNSSDELEGKQESGYNGVGGQFIQQGLPTQQSQNNNIAPSPNGIIRNTGAFVFGFLTFGDSSSMVRFPVNHRDKHKKSLKRLQQITRVTVRAATGTHYTRIDQLVFNRYIQRVFP